MIAGIGVDMVDIARFEKTIERTPRLLERLFTPAERALKPHSLAARYAAKEALIKALGGSDGVHWTEIEVTPEASGRPWFTLTGSTADVIVERGISSIHLSMTHDGGFASAYVIAERAAGAGNRAEDAGPDAAPLATPKEATP
ncbi:holo-ACP synthase [Microbacterium sp. C7(2022)]|uniref:holo-ACP synthase n=1 Tax=Microbacterium sp. C7(2022) TaxID=2992759 RepID=UPI00237A47D2|nr:holo-ACP synthase [Microbacterium sp. C7(2022)]MDE0545427.1 holo-ACP synthase [Microbacterium sp. C7(2022)]